MKIEIIPYGELDNLPQTIYKYRIWSDNLHKEIISQQVVFMARPSSFKDPFDCKLPKRYDLLSDEDIYNKYLNDSKQDHPDWTQQQHKHFAKEWYKKSPMRDKEYLKQIQEDYFKQFDDRFGVLSLTANPKINAMWDEYSENQQGFCVGFDTKKMFKILSGGGLVVYDDNLPDILPFDSHEIEHFKQVYSKKEKWSFEEEYRTYKFYQHPATVEQRRIKIPKDCYRSIIFGASQQEVQRQEIISTCKEQELQVEYYVATTNENIISIFKMPSR